MKLCQDTALLAMLRVLQANHCVVVTMGEAGQLYHGCCIGTPQSLDFDYCGVAWCYFLLATMELNYGAQGPYLNGVASLGSLDAIRCPPSQAGNAARPASR